MFNHEKTVPQNENVSKFTEKLQNTFSRVRDFLKFKKPDIDRRQKALEKVIESVNLPPEVIQEELSKTQEELKKLDLELEDIKKDAKKSFLTSLRDWVKNNKTATAFILSGAIHAGAFAGLNKETQDFFQSVFNRVQFEIQNSWELSQSILHPQTEKERQAIKKKIKDRQSRQNLVELHNYQQDVQDRLKNGQKVSAQELYFKTEEFKGVEPSAIEQAKTKEQEMIKKFIKIMNGKLDEDVIKKIVQEMYGNEDNYSWGQASITEYFNTGKRNCVAINLAEQMVFEELIKHLPPAEQKHYQLGTAFEKQHVIAILKKLNDEGDIEKTYFLQPPVEALMGKADRPGSPTVSLEELKKSISGQKQTLKSPDTQDVKDSPDIDIISNQPIKINISVQGKLRISDYMRQIAEKRGISPQQKTAEESNLDNTSDATQDMDLPSFSTLTQGQDQKQEIQNKEPNVIDLELLEIDPQIKAEQQIQKQVQNLIDSIQKDTKYNIDSAQVYPDTTLDLSEVNWKGVMPGQVDTVLNKELKPLKDFTALNKRNIENSYFHLDQMTDETIKYLATNKLPFNKIRVSVNSSEDASKIEEFYRARKEIDKKEFSNQPLLFLDIQNTSNEAELLQRLASLSLEKEKIEFHFASALNAKDFKTQQDIVRKILNLSAQDVMLRGDGAFIKTLIKYLPFAKVKKVNLEFSNFAEFIDYALAEDPHSLRMRKGELIYTKGDIGFVPTRKITFEEISYLLNNPNINKVPKIGEWLDKKLSESQDKFGVSE